MSQTRERVFGTTVKLSDSFFNWSIERQRELIRMEVEVAAEELLNTIYKELSLNESD